MPTASTAETVFSTKCTVSDTGACSSTSARASVSCGRREKPPLEQDMQKEQGRNYPALFVELPGFEPRKADPESAVLPLHHSSIMFRTCIRCKIKAYFFLCQILYLKNNHNGVTAPLQTHSRHYCQIHFPTNTAAWQYGFNPRY